MCSLSFLNDSLYLVTVAAPYEEVLLWHWLRHYQQSVGVRRDHITVYIDRGVNVSSYTQRHGLSRLQRDASSRAHMELTHAIEASLNADRMRTQLVAAGVLVSTFSQGLYSIAGVLKIVNSHVASLPANAYLIFAEVDEFFTYPCNMAEQVEQHDLFCAGELG